MSHATIANATFTPIQYAHLQRHIRIGTEALLAALQSATLALFLWLILAGPGFLQDMASAVPLR